MSCTLTISEMGEALLGGMPLHPSAAQLDAAAQDVQSLLDSSSPKDTLVMAGMGLGWHLKAVLSHPHRPHVVAYEPDPAKLAMQRCLGPELSGFELATNTGELAEILGRKLVYEGQGKVAVFTHRAYVSAEPEMVTEVGNVVEQALARKRSDEATRLAVSDDWMNNLVRNFGLQKTIADITLMAGALQGIPALVVGAGPSLAESLAQTSNWREKALVLAASSALPALNQAGEPPHLALAIEARNESRQFISIDTARTALAAASAGHPGHFSAWPGVRTLFHLQPWLNSLTGCGETLPTGGHVTSAAFSLAVLLGCSPIVLVGQDLAYGRGKAYAPGRVGADEQGKQNVAMVDSINGEKVESNEIWLSYLGWYAEAMNTLAVKRPDIRVINATAYGAKIPGMEHTPLDEAFAQIPKVNDDLDIFINAIGRLPAVPQSVLIRNLHGAVSDLRRETQKIMNPAYQPATAGFARSVIDSAGIKPDRDALKKKMESMIRILRGMEEGLYD